jgi:spermidine synthase
MFAAALSFVKPYTLLGVVFLTGAAVLIIEVTAVRILSPYFGNTIFAVSSVISVILGALSGGYYFGGRFADRHPSLLVFYGIIFASGIAVLIVQGAITFILPTVGYLLSPVSGPLISSIFLFFLPAFLLGMLSPYAVRLQKDLLSYEGVGSAAGAVFFWSTLGSIVGSLVTGFVLIPVFGIRTIITGTGLFLAVLGGVAVIILLEPGRQRTVMFFLMLGLLTVLTGAASITHSLPGTLYMRDGLYERIRIYDNILQGRAVRFLELDRASSGAMFLDTEDPRALVYGFSKYYSLYKLSVPSLQRALVIGGGSYSIPKVLLAEEPRAQIDVVEIEPDLFELAQQFFDVGDDPRLTNYVEDGRRFLLRQPDDSYDLIFNDAYQTLYSIPAHFITKEYFELAHAKLADRGVYIANYITDLQKEEPSLFHSSVKTFREVFPHSMFFAVRSPSDHTLPQNVIFVGYKSGDTDTFADALARDDTLGAFAAQRIDLTGVDFRPYPLLTDDYAPSDAFTIAILKHARQRKQ